MEKITSFTIDHLKLVPGLYVSRKDFAGEQVITTFDIRMTNPNVQKFTPSNILVQPSFVTTGTTHQKHFTLDQWDAVPASTFFL